jgi:hypothetical protein
LIVQSVISHCVLISKLSSKEGAEMFLSGTVYDLQVYAEVGGCTAIMDGEIAKENRAGMRNLKEAIVMQDSR